MANVVLKNINKSFGKISVIRGLNLDIKDGEFIVLVGPSGCGKTTLLRMIAGLEEVPEGEIFIADRLVNQIEPKDRGIAMVFQNYALYPHLSVRKNLEFGLKMRGYAKEKIRQKVSWVAELLKVENLLDRKPKELSGGQRQRVAMGRAIAREPQVFLFDEPLSNLDADLRVKIRTQIAKLHHDLKITTIYVTHDQIEAMTLANRLVIINEGVMQQVGVPMEVYHNPVNQFVASFIGTPQINFIPMTPVFNNQTIHFKRRDFSFTVSKDRYKQLRTYENREIIIGIRPEFVKLDPQHEHYSINLSATIEVKETLGHETLYSISIGETKKLFDRAFPFEDYPIVKKIPVAFQ
jgi:multiple sugar transport system ATP-binding protein